MRSRIMLTRDPFWWPMAEPPMPRERRDQVELFDYFGVTLPGCWRAVLEDAPLENPRDALRYLDLVPPEVQRYLGSFHGGDL